MSDTAQIRNFAQSRLPFCLLLMALLSACGPQPAEQAARPLPPATISCAPGSFVETSLFGVIETNIAWSGSDMRCENMQRPNGEGVRLQFVGDVGEERLSLIIALPELDRGAVGVESPSNVTVTVEGNGRFFSTPNLDSCWTEVSSHESLADSNHYQIDATLFCIAPLGEINGDGAVSIPKLRFRSSINWGNAK